MSLVKMAVHRKLSCFSRIIIFIVVANNCFSTSLGQTTPYIPNCGSDLQCADSLACYPQYAQCDSYNDCGTNFDEVGCTPNDVCADLQPTAPVPVAFRDACSSQRVNSSRFQSGADFALDGEFNFTVPAQSSWIERIYFDIEQSILQQAFPLRSFAYFLIKISLIQPLGNRSDPINSTTIPIYVERINGTLLPETRELRFLLLVNPSEVGSILVEVFYVADQPPNLELGYRKPQYLAFETISMEFASYFDSCAAGLQPGGNLNPCLLAVWDYLQLSESTRMDGSGSLTACQPQERAGWLADLYGGCFDPPQVIVPPDYSGLPGEFQDFRCIAFGSPSPVILWDSFGSESLLFVTLENGTDETFTCTAQNIAGVASAQLRVTSKDFMCISLGEELENYRNTQLAPCAARSQSPASGQTFGQSYLQYFPLPQELILESTMVPLDLYQFVGRLITFRISVTTEPFLPLNLPSRKKRKVIPIIYQKDYVNVDTVGADRSLDFLVEFSPPVFVEPRVPLYLNVLTLNDEPFTQLFFEVAPPLNSLQCPVTKPLNPIDNATCYEKYDNLTALENRYIDLGCTTDYSVTYRNYEACLRVADTVPTVLESPPVPTLSVGYNVTLMCPIEGAVQSYWLKMGRTRSSLAAPMAPSPILKITNFESGDQGYYFCQGIGGGMYRDVVVTSEPIRLALQGVTTLFISVGYNETFIAMNDPNFVEIAPSLRSPVSSAFRSDGHEGLSVGPDDIFSPEFPYIAATREGSLFVDFLVGIFTGDNNTGSFRNDTALVEYLSNSLQNYLEEVYPSQESSSAPRPIELPLTYIPGSLVISSASSCLGSEVTGLFGTLTFPTARVDETVNSVEHCKDYSNNTPIPRATRTCRGNFVSPSTWEEPLLNDCFVNENPNNILQNIAQTKVTAENVTEYTSDLVLVTEDSSMINADGIIAVADALQKILQIADPSPEVTINVITIVDNILQVDYEAYIESLGVEAPSRILDSLEQQVTLFQLSNVTGNLTVVGQNVGVFALQLPKSSLTLGLGFATLTQTDASGVYDVLNENKTMVYLDAIEIPQSIVDASIALPSIILNFLSSLPENDTANETVAVSFFIFQNSKLFQSQEQVYALSRGRRLAVGTRVISATIEGVVITGLPAGREVVTTFLELNVTEEGEMVDNRSCVFWEKTLIGGRWSTEGCRREDDVDGRIRCLCDHLTSFAVLLDISGDIGVRALDILSIIGCIISIICLVITLVTYLGTKKLRSKQPQQILINLCLALLGLYLVFVIGIDRRYPTGGCIVAGFLIHYFLLASMSWMLVEAVNMYLMFVKVLNANISKFMLKASLCAWGLPLIVCIIIVAVDTSHYLGDDTYCFVKPGLALYLGVILLIALIIIINFVIFFLVMQRLTCRKAVSAHKSVDSNEAWRRVQNAIAISVLMGLAWVFGFLAIGGARIVFNIIFLIFNSLQGLFVFIMFCLRQDDVKHQWARWIRCQFEEERPGVRGMYTKGVDKSKSTDSESAVRLQKVTYSGGTVSTTASSGVA